MYISLIINIRSSLIHPHGFQLVMLLMWLIEVSSFICTNNKSASKVKFRQASNCCKRVLETAKLVYVNKTKESITFLGVDLTFWKLLILFSTKNANLDDSGIFLPAFSSRTNLKLHHIHVTLKLVKKIKTSLKFSKASGPGCIPVVVMKKCQPELSYIIAGLFNMCLKKSCFPDCWKVLSEVLVFKNVGERSMAKNYHPVSLLSVVSKVFGKVVNNRLLMASRNAAFFWYSLWFQVFSFSFRSSDSCIW